MSPAISARVRRRTIEGGSWSVFGEGGRDRGSFDTAKRKSAESGCRRKSKSPLLH